jgi:(p)ppGpp synthase/HD superfamily hydrolase
MAGNSNPRFDEALAFAAQAHGVVKQELKGTDFPYIADPIRVAEILDRFECNEEVVVAGFLHDTIEDANVTADEISAAFGPRIATIVTAVTEADKSLPWKERKQRALDQLEQEADRDVLALVAADKLDNVRSIVDAIRHAGEKKTWALFNAKKRDQHWYYRSIVEILLDHDQLNRLFRTLDFETQTLFPDRRRPTSFFPGKQLGTPHDARAYLADPMITTPVDRDGITLRLGWVKEC